MRARLRQALNSALLPILIFCLSSQASEAASLPAAPSTALMVSAINQPHVVRGSDGMDHLEYDLLITNAFATPVTLQAVEVIGPDGKVIERIDGDTLAAATQGVLLQAPVSSIPASGSATVEIDVALKPGMSPKHIFNRIIYKTPDASAHLLAILGGDTVLGPELRVSPFRAITIAPPLQGAGWASFNGCCTPNGHRNVRVAASTRIGTAETFAIDFLRVDGNRFYSGDGKSNDQYPYFGVPVHAVAGGTVVAIHDGMPETQPFGEATTVMKPEDFGGNYVLVRQSAGVYAFYAHLKMGSVAVKAGQPVTVGQVLGALGSSGNSTNPHLHFGLLDRPDFMTGYSLPFVFPAFKMSGRITDGHDDGTLVIQSDDRTMNNAYPLVGSITGFP